MPVVIASRAQPSRLRTAVAALVLGLACAAAVDAAALASQPSVVKTDTRVVELYAARTTTVELPYPDALEFAGASYSSRVRIIGSPRDVGGARPRLSLIRVLSSESTEGGSLLKVRIRNRNPRGTLAARAIVTAVTTEPASSG